MRFLIIRFLVFTENTLSDDESSTQARETALHELCEFRERKLGGGCTLNSCVMR